MEALVLLALLLPLSARAGWPIAAAEGAVTSRQAGGDFSSISGGALRSALGTAGSIAGTDARLVEAQETGDQPQQPNDWVLFFTCFASAQDLDSSCSEMLPAYCLAFSCAVVSVIIVAHRLKRAVRDRKLRKKAVKAEKEAEKTGVRCPACGSGLTRYQAPGGSHLCNRCGNKAHMVYGCRQDKWAVCTECHMLMVAENIPGAPNLNLKPSGGSGSFLKAPTSAASLLQPVEKKASAPEPRASERKPQQMPLAARSAPERLSGRAHAAQQQEERRKAVAAAAAAGGAEAEGDGKQQYDLRMLEATESGEGGAAGSQQKDEKQKEPDDENRSFVSQVSGVSDVSGFSEVSNYSDFSEFSDADDGQDRSRKHVSKRWRAAGTRGPRPAPEVHVEIELTAEILEAEGKDNIEAWLEAQVDEQAKAKGIPPQKLEKLHFTVAVTDAKGGKYKAWDDLEALVSEGEVDVQEFFPVNFVYSAKLEKPRRKKLDNAQFNRGTATVSPTAGSGKMWHR